MSVVGVEQLDDVASEEMSFAEQAYLVIRDKLIMLDIRPNEAIVESDLAAELKLGRTPVREALKRLEVDRLVVSFPRRGTFATGVDVADLRHISQIRVNLEPVAARSAAENASADVRAGLLKLADRTETLDVENTHRDELMRWDLRAHRAIYRASGNPYLEDVLVRYDNLATRIFCLFLDRLPTVAQHVGEHAELLRTIAGGDGDAAAQIALDHVIGFEKAVRAIV
ncbi:GntR family transcriptional regulator [Mycolicibacterium aubagnense]|uniref:GntR family transcriptional regulator n=1 Tax=Mycolicibacterium aubagnense TaxID=319707 RepID=A0ABM7IC31_9MYCO|nr:GntR family transcriptional regulator [Mycolicibacterium aubagnense]TLH57556.1 GntR family transcriptional regulator [Mycolicibacterium aubagnense]WGI34000.1 GntR family transcriptional regulator [Mycolicibacterium aubagnense]BBX84207.1 GntR family transcriptional regulator [Mycolicibacterium aubagnense]